MNKLIVYSLAFTAFFLSSCVSRIIPYEVDRVDQELKGNRGIVRGKAKDLPEVERKKTKRIYKIEVELSSRFDKELKKEDVSGNKGYISRKKILEEKSRPVKIQKEVGELKAFEVSQEQVVESEEKYKKEKGKGILIKKEIEQKIYVVQKGDSLQKISSKMYGTTRRWKKIYEANKDVLKSPDVIKPGQRLVIPEE